MKNLIAFPNRARVREEAATWAARVDRGLSDAERAELKEWLATSAHRQAFLEFASLWDQMDCLGELAELFPLQGRGLRVRSATTGYRVLRAAAVAGCVALVAAFLASSYWRVPAPAGAIAEDMSRSSTSRFATAVGERTTVSLQDGSAVTLNTNTLLEVRFVASAREVYLQRGEAFFSVAHVPDRPFNVHAGDRTVQAVGTAFNVRVHELGRIEVTVTEGKVKVWSAASLRAPLDEVAAPAVDLSETILTANEALVVNDDAPAATKVDAVEMDVRLAWQRGMLIFSGDPLDAVLAEVARYTTVDFVIEDEALRDIRVGGYFRAGDIEGLLLALEQNFRIDAQRTSGGTVVLTSAPGG